MLQQQVEVQKNPAAQQCVCSSRAQGPKTDGRDKSKKRTNEDKAYGNLDVGRDVR